mmetsp:Transcript_21748/g.62366  ORF Transcript_21748/g.62366 Transcript_21748/m.62366 type:complete len:207 (+) Transcript_21748:1724-2344(+)
MFLVTTSTTSSAASAQRWTMSRRGCMSISVACSTACPCLSLELSGLRATRRLLFRTLPRTTAPLATPQKRASPFALSRTFPIKFSTPSSGLGIISKENSGREPRMLTRTWPRLISPPSSPVSRRPSSIPPRPSAVSLSMSVPPPLRTVSSGPVSSLKIYLPTRSSSFCTTSPRIRSLAAAPNFGLAPNVAPRRNLLISMPNARMPK